jgi:hypothetical protein
MHDDLDGLLEPAIYHTIYGMTCMTALARAKLLNACYKANLGALLDCILLVPVPRTELQQC